MVSDILARLFGLMSAQPYCMLFDSGLKLSFELKNYYYSSYRDYTDFLEDLEEDAQFRTNINIYRDSSKQPRDGTESEAGDLPQIGLEEMLEDLHIESDPTGEEGAEMVE